MTTYLCPRCQGNAEAKPCSLCGGTKRVAWDGGAKTLNTVHAAGARLNHLELWRLETDAAKAVRP